MVLFKHVVTYLNLFRAQVFFVRGHKTVLISGPQVNLGRASPISYVILPITSFFGTPNGPFLSSWKKSP